MRRTEGGIALHRDATESGRRLWLLAGLFITVPLLVVGIVARTLLKMNFVVLSGLIAGRMTDPPALAFANTLMNKDAPFGVLPAGLSTSAA